MNYKILVVFFVLWFGVLALSGALFSGYHFTDDHEVLRIDKNIRHTTIAREGRLFLKNLFSAKMRFRPLHIMHRRAATAVFGTGFFAWSVYFGLLAVFTSFFLFLFMRKTGFYAIEAFFFACLTLLGEQAAVWWKLGTNETLGMFMLSVAMFFMAQSVYAEKRNKLYNILFIIFTILMSWCKESFILMIPALVFWQIWLTEQKFFGGIQGPRGAGDLLNKPLDVQSEAPLRAKSQELTAKPKTPPGRRRQDQLWLAVRKNIITTVILLFVCATELIHIVKNVGTTGIKYAGYEGFSLSGFIDTFIQLFISSHGWVILLQLGIIISILFFRLQVKRIRLRYIFPGNFHWSIILFGLIVLPQVVLYMKSGIMERYLLPGLMGYTFLMIVLYRSFGILMAAKPAKRWPALIVVLIFAVVFFQGLRVIRYNAIAFAHEGKHTNGWFQSVKNNTREGDLILVITHPVKYLEPSVSLKAYLEIALERKGIYFSPVTVTPGRGGFWRQLNRGFPHRFPGVEFSAVLVFPDLEEPFLTHAPRWFKSAEFKRYTNEGGFVSYYKDGAAENADCVIK